MFCSSLSRCFYLYLRLNFFFSFLFLFLSFLFFKKVHVEMEKKKKKGKEKGYFIFGEMLTFLVLLFGLFPQQNQFSINYNNLFQMKLNILYNCNFQYVYMNEYLGFSNHRQHHRHPRPGKKL